MIRAGIIGCGFIADQHASQIQSMDNAMIVGVCDREPLMAEQLADRFHIPYHTHDVHALLCETRPNVVHITTPAQTHYALGRLCLEHGASVYMEKPFTVTASEAQELVDLSRSQGCHITVGHNLQFSPETIRMRKLVRDGYLGGTPVHMDCIQCYSHQDPTYGKALLGDSTHWIRALPGSLLQNLISHGIAKIAEYLPAGKVSVKVDAYTSSYVRGLGQPDVIDELQAIIRSETGVTANFTFTTRFAVGNQQFRLFGSANGLLVDNHNRALVRMPLGQYKLYARHFIMPFVVAREYRRSAWSNMRQFLKRDFHMDYGMRVLIREFYRTIEEGTESPIPAEQILRTAEIMDEIFAQIQGSA